MRNVNATNFMFFGIFPWRRAKWIATQTGADMFRVHKNKLFDEKFTLMDSNGFRIPQSTFRRNDFIRISEKYCGTYIYIYMKCHSVNEFTAGVSICDVENWSDYSTFIAAHR